MFVCLCPSSHHKIFNPTFIHPPFYAKITVLAPILAPRICHRLQKKVLKIVSILTITLICFSRSTNFSLIFLPKYQCLGASLALSCQLHFFRNNKPRIQNSNFFMRPFLPIMNLIFQSLHLPLHKWKMIRFFSFQQICCIPLIT